eukprot:3882414-Ditylum_brightwellii.AAC.1
MAMQRRLHMSASQSHRHFIVPNKRQHLDPIDEYHVVCLGSSIFEYNTSLPPGPTVKGDLICAVVCVGKHDKSSFTNQYHIDFGCGGQDCRNGIPVELIGIECIKE